MDTYSLAVAARALGTSAPRLRRAVDRLGVSVERTASGVFRLTSRQVDEFARELGAAPSVPELSRVETRMLAALSRSSRGGASVREAARRAGVSPTAAARALARLTSEGLIAQTPMMLAQGHAVEATVYQVLFGSPRWLALARVRLPARREGPHARRVPPHLQHLFWNAAPAQLDVANPAPFIARRLITSFDPDGLARGTANLPASAREHAAATRGLEPAQRALAHNLARYAPDAPDRRLLDTPGNARSPRHVDGYLRGPVRRRSRVGPSAGATCVVIADTADCADARMSIGEFAAP
jgi:DNA-binding transcriptional ArsR family regulator